MFHLDVDDRLGYACRLLRKACARQVRVVVGGPPAELARLDALLWEFDPASFVPHVRLDANGQVAERLAHTPIWLVDDLARAPHHEVLVNLGDEVLPGFESFDKLIEIVPDDEALKPAARRRWKLYAERGYALQTHLARVRP